MSKCLIMLYDKNEILHNTTLSGILKYGVKLWRTALSHGLQSDKRFEASSETNWGMDDCTTCGRDVGSHPYFPQHIVRAIGKVARR
ncbi:MAG: hypothetical protein AAF636_18660 [Pseudomonadota bacterium]